VKVAGRLKQFIPFWQTLTNDRFILQSVSGLMLDFVDGKVPIQSKIPYQHIFSTIESQAIDTEIARLLEKGVLVYSSHEPGQFINTIFTRPKKDGSHRMILNLKPLNKYIEYKKFKMDTLKTVLQLMHRNCYVASIDISDAYYTVPIHVSHQKFLKFQWNGRLFQYTALPNGYSDAPRVFTKLLKPVFAQLRRLGHIVVGYIDDIYIQAESEQACTLAVQAAVSLLERCGFVIHPTKSCFLPSKNTVYLGFELDSERMTVTLTTEKKMKYIEACNMLTKKDTVSVRTLAKVIGQLVSTFPGVRYGPLYYRNLELAKIQALKSNDQNYDELVEITDNMKSELNWWISNLSDAFGEVSKGQIDIELMTDATLLNWGAKCGNASTGGPFSMEERSRSHANINVCELLAVKLGLQAFQQQLEGKKVLLRSDNMVTIAYISHMGGTRSLICNEIAKEIWQWCIAHDIWLSAEHIAGILNIEADYESRHVDNRLEWAIYPDVFHQLCEKFGTPTIDLFASRINAKLPKFVSWRPEPGAVNINAFSMSWADSYVYLFPPFSLLTKCLQKLMFEGTDALLIAPLWPTQPWFAQILRLLTAIPVMLPKTRMLYLPTAPRESHPLHHLKLIACRLSGNPDKRNRFLTKLSESSATHGVKVHKSNTVLYYANGRDILIDGKLITISQL
jgi:hypothetical protein